VVAILRRRKQWETLGQMPLDVLCRREEFMELHVEMTRRV
jgi:hypothetical protein